MKLKANYDIQGEDALGGGEVQTNSKVIDFHLPFRRLLEEKEEELEKLEAAGQEGNHDDHQELTKKVGE